MRCVLRCVRGWQKGGMKVDWLDRNELSLDHLHFLTSGSLVLFSHQSIHKPLFTSWLSSHETCINEKAVSSCQCQKVLRESMAIGYEPMNITVFISTLGKPQELKKACCCRRWLFHDGISSVRSGFGRDASSQGDTGQPGLLVGPLLGTQSPNRIKRRCIRGLTLYAP